MLTMLMGLQIPLRQVHIKLGAEDRLAEALLVSYVLSCHPEAVRLHRVPPYCVTGLELHNHCLDYVGVQPNPVKQTRQDDERPLNPCCPRLCKYSIFSIKLFFQPLYGLYKTFCYWFHYYLHCCHHRYQDLEDPIYHHVEDHGGERVPLGHAASALEGGTKLSTRP